MAIKKTKLIRLSARILSAPIIAYSLLLAVGYFINWLSTGVADPHAVEDYPFIENLPPIFLFIAVLGLAVAWAKEKIGGIINIVFCSLTLPILFIHWPLFKEIRNIPPYIITLVVALPGILFLIYWKQSEEK